MMTGITAAREPVSTKSEPVKNAGLTMLHTAHISENLPSSLSGKMASQSLLPAGAPDSAQPKKSDKADDDVTNPLSFRRDTHTKNGNTDGITQHSHSSKPDMAAFSTTSPNMIVTAHMLAAMIRYTFCDMLFMVKYMLDCCGICVVE